MRLIFLLLSVIVLSCVEEPKEDPYKKMCDNWVVKQYWDGGWSSSMAIADSVDVKNQSEVVIYKNGTSAKLVNQKIVVTYIPCKFYE